MPSYAINRAPKISNVRRLIKLGRRLNFDEVYLAAGTNARAFVLGWLDRERERLHDDPSYAQKVAATASVRLAAVSVAPGTWVDAWRTTSAT